MPRSVKGDGEIDKVCLVGALMEWLITKEAAQKFEAFKQLSNSYGKFTGDNPSRLE